MITRAKILHVSAACNIESILLHGLQPMIGPRSAEIGEDTPAIYLFQDALSLENALMNWLGDLFEEDESLALFEVTVPTEMTAVAPGQFEVILTVSVPAAKIKLLTDDVDRDGLRSSHQLISQISRPCR